MLRSFLHSEASIVCFPMPRRKTVPWSLKHRVPIQVCFLRGAAIIFAFLGHNNLFPKTSKEDCAHPGLFFLRGAAIIFEFRSPYNLFPKTSKEDCTVVAKTSRGLFFARCCDHFRIPKPLQFISQYLQGRLYRGR